MKKRSAALVSAGVVLLSALMAACGGEPPPEGGLGSDEQAFHTGAGPLRGHEDITRFAVSMGNELVRQRLNVGGYFPAVSEGDSGTTTGNPLVKGSYTTDYPSPEVKSFHGAPPDMSFTVWHNTGWLQNVHSLRNHSATGVESIRSTCFGVQRIVKAVTAKAVAQFNVGDWAGGMFWVGHATHVIQDSFSTIHAKRSGNDYRTINDICTYGPRYAGICYHGAFDATDDRVWGGGWTCQLNPNVRRWSCLKGVAQAAARATAGYLYGVARIVQGVEPGVDQALDRYFDGDPDNPYSGYLACGSVPP